MKTLTTAIKITILFTVLTGLIYPAVVTGLSQVLFHRQASGSLLDRNGKTVGSSLIGQSFTRPEYFHGRSSGAGNNGYDGLNSGGFNQGPTNQKLVDRVKADVSKFRSENPTFTGPIPADMATASASGLDPHISPESAEAQAGRVAAARGVDVSAVRRLIAEHTEERTFGILGDRRVNVLELNLELDRTAPVRK